MPLEAHGPSPEPEICFYFGEDASESESAIAEHADFQANLKQSEPSDEFAETICQLFYDMLVESTAPTAREERDGASPSHAPQVQVQAAEIPPDSHVALPADVPVHRAAHAEAEVPAVLELDLAKDDTSDDGLENLASQENLVH